MRWAIGLAALVLLTGCAGPAIDRSDVDRQLYAECVRAGGQWYGDNQFGGSCRYQGPSFP